MCASRVVAVVALALSASALRPASTATRRAYRSAASSTALFSGASSEEPYTLVPVPTDSFLSPPLIDLDLESRIRRPAHSQIFIDRPSWAHRFTRANSARYTFRWVGRRHGADPEHRWLKRLGRCVAFQSTIDRPNGTFGRGGRDARTGLQLPRDAREKRALLKIRWVLGTVMTLSEMLRTSDIQLKRLSAARFRTVSVMVSEIDDEIRSGRARIQGASPFGDARTPFPINSLPSERERDATRCGGGSLCSLV